MHQCTKWKDHQWSNPSTPLPFPWNISRRFVNPKGLCLGLTKLLTSWSMMNVCVVSLKRRFLWQDLRLALSLAESVSQSTPIAAAANELYKVAKSHGLSDQDFSAVIEALKAKLQQWLQYLSLQLLFSCIYNSFFPFCMVIWKSIIYKIDLYL